MTEVFKVRPAQRIPGRIILGLCGPSGWGKTKSALLVAKGLAGPEGEIVGIDTESGRMLEYAPPSGLSLEEERRGLDEGKWFKFGHMEFSEPYSYARYKAAIAEALRSNPKVIIIDSMSHGHEGPGGHLNQHEAAVQRMSKGDANKAEKLKAVAWIQVKAEFHDFLYWVTRQPCNFIFCFRARKKMKPMKDANGKMEFVQQGFVPITTEGFDFEMSARLMLAPNEGVKDWPRGAPLSDPEFYKVNDGFKDIFVPGKQITIETGHRLAAWASIAKDAGRDSASSTKPPVSQPADEGPGDPPPSPEPARFTINRGKNTEGVDNIAVWKARFIDGIGKMNDTQAEAILKLNRETMKRLEMTYPEEVQIVREAFRAKIGIGD